MANRIAAFWTKLKQAVSWLKIPTLFSNNIKITLPEFLWDATFIIELKKVHKIKLPLKYFLAPFRLDNSWVNHVWIISHLSKLWPFKYLSAADMNCSQLFLRTPPQKMQTSYIFLIVLAVWNGPWAKHNSLMSMFYSCPLTIHRVDKNNTELNNNEGTE